MRKLKPIQTEYNGYLLRASDQPVGFRHKEHYAVPQMRSRD